MVGTGSVVQVIVEQQLAGTGVTGGSSNMERTSLIPPVRLPCYRNCDQCVYKGCGSSSGTAGTTVLYPG